MTENDDINLKNELIKNIKNIEVKIVNIIKEKEIKIDDEIEQLNKKVNDVIEKSNITIENFSSQKIDHQKLIDLEGFKKKVDAMLITHEIRINNNIQDIVKIQNKYDKTISDNLILSGYIGAGCQFKNIGEYIYNNITELSKIKSEKDQIKKDTKDSKTKIDSLMKQMIVLNDASIERCTEYVDNKQKDIEDMINGKFIEFNDKINEIRVIFSNFQTQIDKQINNFQSEIIKILNMKNDIKNIIDEKNEDNKNFINDVHKKVVLNIQDIGILKKKINEINEFNTYYKRKYSNKKINNILKRKEFVKSFQGIYNPNYKDYLKNKNYTLNSLSAKPKVKENEFMALNFDSFPENIINNNLLTINNNLDLKKKQVKEREREREREKEKERKFEIKKVNLKDKEKIIHSEYSSKKKNFFKTYKSIDKYKIQKKKKKTKTDSYENLLIESNIMPKPKELFILDQKILSDADLKAKKEKKSLKKEIIKKNVEKNLFNLRIISGNNPLDLYNYSTSVPKFSPIPQKKNKIIFNSTKLNKLEERKNKQESKTLNNTKLNLDKTNFFTNINPNADKTNIFTNTNSNLEKTNTNSDKTNLFNNYKLVNLELEENATINPDTNNGAYVIAKKQTENNNVSKLNITPTSYVNVYNVSQKSTRLMNMTFAKEEIQKIKNPFIRAAYNEIDKNK